MEDRICIIEGCDKPVKCKSRGWCNPHYQRWYRHGDPLISKKCPPFCSIEGCDRPYCTNGWCSMHYHRWQRYGDPLHRERVRGEGDEARFLFHVDKRGPDECWPWTAFINAGGYGTFGLDGPGNLAHRWSYEHFVKPIPDGLQLDHLCHTRERLTCPGGPTCPHRRCVNPAHLEPVPQKVNVERGVNTKLSGGTADALYERWIAGQSKAALAREAGVGKSTMSRRLNQITKDRGGA